MSNKGELPLVLWYNQLGMNDVDRVGGKNASLGEMITNLSSLGVSVPNGFATTSEAFNLFLDQSGVNQRIYDLLDKTNIDDVDELAKAGKQIRQWIVETPFTPQLEQAIHEAYNQLSADDAEASFAVRSSATAEDMPDASFAGQQETFLNVQGYDAVLVAVKHVYASLFNDRAISYRVHQGYDHRGVALSAGVQRMVRSDLASSGVMFTIDTESGFDQVVFITSALGLGEMVVQGAVNPDEFYVHKPTLAAGRPAIVRRNMGSKKIRMVYADSQEHGEQVRIEDVPEAERDRFSLTDSEVEALAAQAVQIEKHYQRPMDIEWAKDGHTGKLFIVQARPETVRSNGSVMERYTLQGKGNVVVEGRAIGHRIGAGEVKVIHDISEMNRIEKGDVLVTDMTDPDWEPIMKKASAIVTNRGGRTCHAAIIARELGIPAVVGCGNATDILKDGNKVTVSCAEGDTGYVYNDLLDFEVKSSQVDEMPSLPLKIMMNVGNPDRAFDFACLPNEGVGLARLEFIINRMIGVHPKALLEFDQQTPELQQQIRALMKGFDDPVEFYIARLTEGIATLGAAFAPKRVIVRLSDFKTNEYANLVGGERYEPEEENPMLGFRGAGRYVADSFRDCFALECAAMKRVRNDMGLTNVEVMVPFVRTVAQAKAVVEELERQGLKRGENGLKIIMMCEIPSNALLADEFLQYFDGFSIGSNDMTQLALGLDRDSGVVSELFDERNDAVKALLSMAIRAAKKQGKYVGICGQGPSDHEDFAAWLMEEGIDSLSLNPDTVVQTWLSLAELKK
ncbi:phosphoenolpyruvate synthase [Erwinia aphidicola]|uniref:phosphoenolpyruvate synthase n=1 Tax=Erwinia TaxID=551 RepID=UPI0006645331|nr:MULTISPECIES: phosphoenolpyruvate synthase [Erwinia]KMV70437.1 phosphoenolpyruvate synthase [bacteria symbiont BFo1 of Frankliniella occidentalis]PIJ55463.1 phosphoenolpyruvate synthase [Erwinia sp. OLMDLW33]KYP84681.1 phosphoenolpyruvate synthase [bacteria symbiont BFo1 of Frankliniella occidentalis]KYP90014.1 phosphoenolpyruvate synthase [bacteria symbiont BFo1 of Frankliniella occidentalis]MBD1376967.1 phosphoenolpyruvate synthase [Erwinia aphidicola]